MPHKQKGEMNIYLEMFSKFNLAAFRECIYLTPPLRAWYDTRSVFIFKQSKTCLDSEFTPPWLVAKPRLKNPVYPSSYLWLVEGGKEKIASYFSWGHKHKVKRRQLRPGFELASPITFPKTVNVTLNETWID